MHHRSTNIVVASSVLATLATTFIALRFWARATTKTGFGSDDFLAVGALVLALGICALSIVGAVVAGIGAHAELETSGPNTGFPVAGFLMTYGKLFYAMQILHTCAMPLVKASLLLFYRRVFGVSKRFTVAMGIVAVFVAAWFVAILFATIFQCHPIESNWSISKSGYENCISNPHTFWAASALTNVVSDVAIVLIPIPLVAKLQMSTHHKVLVIAYVLTSVLVVIAGIGRTASLLSTDVHSVDWSYETADWFIWTPMEAALGVVGICLPIMQPIFSKVKPSAVAGAASRLVSRTSGKSNVYIGNEKCSESRNYSDDKIALKNTQPDAYQMHGDVQLPRPAVLGDATELPEQIYYPNGFSYLMGFWERRRS